MDKRTLFRHALLLQGQSLEEWAERHGCTARMVQYVLSGERRSPDLDAAIERTIRESLPLMRRLVQGARRLAA